MIQHMHITIATGLYPPDIGGPATYAVMLEQELPAHGFSITTVPFTAVRRYPKIIRHLRYTWKLWCASKNTDIIYALDPVSVGVSAWVVATARRKKFVLRVPGDYAWEQGQLRFGITDQFHDFIEKRYQYNWRVSALSRIESFIAAQAVQVIVPSRYMATAIEKWGVAAEKIKVIYSALEPLPISEKRETLRAQQSFPFPTLVSAGRLVPNKGFLGVIDAFVAIKAQYKDALLVIVGDGPQQSVLEKYVEEKELVDGVRFVGRYSKEAMGAVIRAADVFVLNTAHEGLSHQLLEVMDLGTPIVTTAVGGNPELITDGINGYLVPYNDTAALTTALLQMLHHPESRERMVQMARSRSKEFSKEAVVAEIATLLKSIAV